MITESILALLTLLLIKPLLIIVLLIAGLLLLNKKSAALQHFWLATGMVALLLLPLFFGLLPEIQWQVLPTTSHSSDQLAWVYRIISWLSAPDRLVIATAVYCLGVFWLLFYLGLGILALFLQTRQSRICHDVELCEVVQALSFEMGISRSVTLVLSDDVSSPQMWGFIRPVIMLPATAATWSSERKLAVLLHEMGHVARYDWATTMAVKICCALFWFLPPVWWLASRLFHYAEIACDDFIYRLHSNYQLRNKAVTYAENLLAMAQTSGPSMDHTDPVLPMAGHSPIFYRIEAILDQRRQRDNATPEARQYWVLILVVMLLPLSSLQLMPIQQALMNQMLSLRLHDFSEDEKPGAPTNEVNKTQVHRLDAETLLKLKQQLVSVDAPVMPLEKITVIAPQDFTESLGKNDTPISSPFTKFQPIVQLQGYMPLESVIPIYPRPALQNGIEGEVVVTFSIAEDGSIFAPRIVRSTPGRVFDRAVLQALQRSRYTPQIIDGTPVIIEGVMETFTFQIEETSFADKRRR